MLKKKIQELLLREQSQDEKTFEVIHEAVAAQIVGGACESLQSCQLFEGSCGSMTSCGTFREK